MDVAFFYLLIWASYSVIEKMTLLDPGFDFDLPCNFIPTTPVCNGIAVPVFMPGPAGCKGPQGPPGSFDVGSFMAQVATTATSSSKIPVPLAYCGGCQVLCPPLTARCTYLAMITLSVRLDSGNPCTVKVQFADANTKLGGFVQSIPELNDVVASTFTGFLRAGTTYNVQLTNETLQINTFTVGMTVAVISFCG